MKLPVPGRFSITFKIAASLSLLILFLMLSLGFVTLYQLKETVQREETGRGQYLTRILSSRVAGPLRAGDKPAIHRLLEEFMAETGVQSVAVLDSGRRLVASGGSPRPDEALRRLTEFDHGDFQVHYDSNGSFYFSRQMQTADGKTLGYLVVAAQAGHWPQNVRNLAVYLGTTTIIAIIAGIFLAIIISRRILNKPIADLSAATEYIATGDFSRKVNLHHRDELGNLAMSFNTMTGYLANLFRSITSYTGELVKSCQSLNNSIKSTGNASQRLVEFMDGHVGKTKEHIVLLQGCADLAGRLVEGVEQAGQALQKSAGEIFTAMEGVLDPETLVARAAGDVDEVKRSLDEAQKAVISHKQVWREMQRVSGLFAEYLDRSGTFNFKIALEVARLGGRDMSGELEDLQKLADEGAEKTNDIMDKIALAVETADYLERLMEGSMQAAVKGRNSIGEAGERLRELDARLETEKHKIDETMSRMEENINQGEQLLEKMEHLMSELEKTVDAYVGTGEAGRKQLELLGQLEATLRRILRVSNALNNLCLQFKV